MIRGVIITAAALLATGCRNDPPPQPAMDFESVYARAEVVKICADGTMIGRDPVSGSLVYGRTGVLTTVHGRIAKGVTVDQVCER